MSGLHDRLEEVFRLTFGDDDLTITDATTAEDVEGWDSAAHISLMFGIEEEFGVRFSDEELTAFDNVGELKAHLKAKGCGDDV